MEKDWENKSKGLGKEKVQRVVISPQQKRQRSQEADGLPEEEEVGRRGGDKRKGTDKEAM